MLAAGSGFLIVGGITLADSLASGVAGYALARVLFLGAITGMQAGLSASKGYEVVKDGIAHTTTPSS